MARENLFEPRIAISRKERTKVLTTDFHLAFDNKKDILYALVAFYKGIVDWL